ncbi:MAG TPA: cyclopropane-fatty-acyl-phospholipid synthase family protein [Abditibacteriaceae bacterium]|jgi:cyclopropane-fatty-acyl-phospholipid synthase
MRLLSNMLQKFVKTGSLTVVDAGGKRFVFSGAAGPEVTMRFHDATLPSKIFRNPELAVGEAYMDGTLTFEGCSVYDFLYLFSINRGSLTAYPLQKVVRRISRLLRSVQQHNPVGKAQKNVAHHYDISRELYKLFLDDNMQYSCAYFVNDDDTLEQAQIQKMNHLASKLQLKSGQKVLDIGCGWGGLSLHLASVADVEVLGVTLSKEQLAQARERAEAMGLSKRVRFELQDYRHVNEKFDRIVSVGMFEHVGVNHFPEFFTKLGKLLDKDGVAVLHSIGRMSPPGSTSPWIRKYIFPGAYAPSLSEVFAAVEQKQLWVADCEILRIHYAKTCHEWYLRFMANRDKAKEMYDERFCRMFEFYLAAVEMTFWHGSAMVFQMQLCHKRDAVPLTRDYISDSDRALQKAK